MMSTRGFIFVLFIIIPLTVIAILFFIDSSIPPCDRLYQDFGDCDTHICVTINNCNIQNVPVITQQCTYGGYTYYPNTNPPNTTNNSTNNITDPTNTNPVVICPVPYVFPMWLVGVCILILVANLAITFVIYFKNQLSVFVSILSLSDEDKVIKCTKCNKTSPLNVVNKICGKCYGVGKLHTTRFDTFDPIVWDNDILEVYPIFCESCKGTGKVQTIDLICPFCDRRV